MKKLIHNFKAVFKESLLEHRLVFVGVEDVPGVVTGRPEDRESKEEVIKSPENAEQLEAEIKTLGDKVDAQQTKVKELLSVFLEESAQDPSMLNEQTSMTGLSDEEINVIKQILSEYDFAVSDNLDELKKQEARQEEYLKSLEGIYKGSIDLQKGAEKLTESAKIDSSAAFNVVQEYSIESGNEHINLYNVNGKMFPVVNIDNTLYPSDAAFYDKGDDLMAPVLYGGQTLYVKLNDIDLVVLNGFAQGEDESPLQAMERAISKEKEDVLETEVATKDAPQIVEVDGETLWGASEPEVQETEVATKEAPSEPEVVETEAVIDVTSSEEEVRMLTLYTKAKQKNEEAIKELEAYSISEETFKDWVMNGIDTTIDKLIEDESYFDRHANGGYLVRKTAAGKVLLFKQTKLGGKPVLEAYDLSGNKEQLANPNDVYRYLANNGEQKEIAKLAATPKPSRDNLARAVLGEAVEAPVLPQNERETDEFTATVQSEIYGPFASKNAKKLFDNTDLRVLNEYREKVKKSIETGKKTGWVEAYKKIYENVFGAEPKGQVVLMGTPLRLRNMTRRALKINRDEKHGITLSTKGADYIRQVSEKRVAKQKAINIKEGFVTEAESVNAMPRTFSTLITQFTPALMGEGETKTFKVFPNRNENENPLILKVQRNLDGTYGINYGHQADFQKLADNFNGLSQKLNTILQEVFDERSVTQIRAYEVDGDAYDTADMADAFTEFKQTNESAEIAEEKIESQTKRNMRIIAENAGLTTLDKVARVRRLLENNTPRQLMERYMASRKGGTFKKKQNELGTRAQSRIVDAFFAYTGISSNAQMAEDAYSTSDSALTYLKNISKGELESTLDSFVNLDRDGGVVDSSEAEEKGVYEMDEYMGGVDYSPRQMLKRGDIVQSILGARRLSVSDRSEILDIYRTFKRAMRHRGDAMGPQGTKNLHTPSTSLCNLTGSAKSQLEAMAYRLVNPVVLNGRKWHGLKHGADILQIEGETVNHMLMRMAIATAYAQKIARNRIHSFEEYIIGGKKEAVARNIPRPRFRPRMSVLRFR